MAFNLVSSSSMSLTLGSSLSTFRNVSGGTMMAWVRIPATLATTETTIASFSTGTSTANAAVVVDVSAAQANLTTHLVPGKIFTEEKSASQQFQTAGKASKEEKARGIIRVYNAYSAANQPLLASTRFVSTDGLLFKSIKREVIPGGTYNKGKLVSGYLDIEVEAAEGGQDYNIAPTTFSIPGFVGTSKYTAFYGKSMAAMAGGFKGEITQISQDDLDKAYTVLAENLKTELQNSLTLKYGSDFVLLKEALSQKIVSNTSSNKLGDQAATFVYQLKVKSKWLGFRKSDLANLAKDVITKDLAKNKQIIESTINISHSVENVDLESGKLILGDKIQAKACFSIDPGAVKLDLAGKPINDARAFLESQPQIEKIKIKSWPFWQKEIPRDLERIEVKINL